MKYTELEEYGWKTIVVDTNSFVSKKEYDENNWMEVFYCQEKNFIQFMNATKGCNGEVIRTMKFEGEFEDIDFWDI